MIEKLIRKLKNKPAYKWESSYSSRDLYVITSVRLAQIIRGYVKKLFLKRSAGFVFAGSNVTIRHGYKVSAGKNLILEDHVYINALSENGICFGDNVSIARNCVLVCTGVIAYKGMGITIGNGTGINAGAYLGGQGGISIGSDVIIGPGVKIFSENHVFSDAGVTIKDQGVTRKGVIIGDNCWIGASVTILDGVTIGSGSVIAAGSVVTRSIPKNTVAAGTPAKIIKQRLEKV